MKTIPQFTLPTDSLLFFRGVPMWVVLIAVGLMGLNARAADVTWTGNSAAANAGTAWRTATNWDANLVPTSVDNAIFDGVGTVTTCAIDMGAAGGTQPVGAVTLGSGRVANLSIRALTTSATDGVLVVSGLGGVLVSNASPSYEITFTNASTGKLLGVGLGNSGSIYSSGSASGSSGRVQIYSVISDVGGPRNLTKIGPGSLYLRGVNTYSGSTTVSAGDLQVDATGTIGNGAGTLYLSGGHLHCGASRNGTSAGQDAIANPIFLTTDAYIFNNTGTANSSRYLTLSGSLGGSSGTLTIANPTTVIGETFAVRFLGGFTFNQPVKIGETLGNAFQDVNGSFSVLEMANYPSNGVQTWNGVISSIGSLRRVSPSSALIGGSSVITGNNTYIGGTLINSGTLFANNASGSALGSGAVTVTNLGTLAGSGSVVASTAVSLNGTISPGSTSSNIATLAVSDLTLGAGANYIWQIAAATGVAGTAWDLVACSSSWTDAGVSSNVITIKVDSQGVVPTGWNAGTARDWVILQSGTANGFDATHFALDTTAFSGTVSGIFSLSVVSGSLHLVYTPASDTVINVATGVSQTQGQVSPTPYPKLTGAVGVTKVGNGEVILTNSLNDYQGSTKIYAGTVSAAVDALNGAAGALGSGSTAVLLGNTLGNSNATLNINVAGVTVGRSVVVQSGSSGVKTLGTTVSSGAATYSGDLTLQDSATLNAVTGGSVLFSGNITGTGGVSLGGGGSITLSAVNSYSGTTLLTGGTLNLNAKALGTNTFTISGVSTLDNTSGASVTLYDCPQNWNANFIFTGSTNLNLGAGAVTMNSNRTVTVSNSLLTVGGTIAGVGFGLTKAGEGELLLGAPTTNSYTGGTTNLAGILAINGTATFGDGTGPLVFSGGKLLGTSSRASVPIANPVFMNAATTIYGDSASTPPSTRIVPFTGNFTMAGNTLKIGNTGLSSNTFIVRFQGGNYSTVNWPIVIGDASFDTAGSISELDLFNDNTTATQIVSGLITGTGGIARGATALNTGGATILAAQNTFAGGVHLDSGAIGFGVSSISSGGAVISGPLGTGNFTLGANNGEASLTIFPSGGTRVIDNRIVLNGITNVIITGTNDLTLSGPFNSGGVAKTLTVLNTGLTAISGAITNTGTSAGGALTKLGAGTLILSGNNTYPGTTTVGAGLLLINNAAGSGTSTNEVTVKAAGTLGGTGSIGGNVSFESSAQARLFKAAGSADSPLTVSGNLTLNGNILAVDLGGTTTLGAGTYRLMNYGGVLSGSFSATPTMVNGALAAGNTATIDVGTAGQVNLVVVSSGELVAAQFPPGQHQPVAWRQYLIGRHRSRGHGLSPLGQHEPGADARDQHLDPLDQSNHHRQPFHEQRSRRDQSGAAFLSVQHSVSEMGGVSV